MKIMAVDAGIANVGVVVLAGQGDLWAIEKLRLIQTEADPRKYRVAKADDDMLRVAYAAREIKALILAHDVKRLCAELPPGGAKSAPALKYLSYAACLLATIAEVMDLFVEWYSPGEVKKCVAGKWSSSKEPVAAVIERLYPQALYEYPRASDREHLLDALAVFETARKTGNITRG